MASVNSVVLVGRLTRDPELRVTPNGNSVTTITLAVDRRPGPDGSKEADFIDCVFFGQTAEATFANTWSKGSLSQSKAGFRPAPTRQRTVRNGRW